jgi:hypothetical protein
MSTAWGWDWDIVLRGVVGMCRDGVYGMVVARWGMGGVGMVFDNGLRCEATRLNFRGNTRGNELCMSTEQT